MTFHDKSSSDNFKIDNFNFSFSMANQAKTSIQDEFDSLHSRIEAILDSEKFYISGVPVLKSIMALRPSKSDLKKLSKAADRLADLSEKYDQVSTNLDIVKTVTENPYWFVSMFGDFSKDLDESIDSIFKGLED